MLRGKLVEWNSSLCRHDVGQPLIVISLADDHACALLCFLLHERNYFYPQTSDFPLYAARRVAPQHGDDTMAIDMLDCEVLLCDIRVGVSVGVSSLTLVTISLERYFAICRPLRSRRWQTVSHSYRMLVTVWMCSFIVMIPIAVNQRHRLLVSGAHKCIEVTQLHYSMSRLFSFHCFAPGGCELL